MAALIFMSDSVGVYWQNDNPYFTYKFGKLGTAIGILYAWVALVPLALYMIVHSMNYKIKWIELMALYGYALTPWLLITIVGCIPVLAIRWILSIIGTAMTGLFMLRNAYPIFSVPPVNVNGTDEPLSWGSRTKTLSAGTLVILILGGCCIGLGLTFQLYFYSH